MTHFFARSNKYSLALRIAEIAFETPDSRFCNRLKHIIVSYQTINILPPRITENQKINLSMIMGVLLFRYSTLMLEALNLFFAKEMLVDAAPFLGLPPCGKPIQHIVKLPNFLKAR
jgi:hypothetical protein